MDGSSLGGLGSVSAGASGSSYVFLFSRLCFFSFVVFFSDFDFLDYKKRKENLTVNKNEDIF